MSAMTAAERKRLSRQRRREQGLCIECGAPRDSETLCEGCLERLRLAAARRRRARG